MRDVSGIVAVNHRSVPAGGQPCSVRIRTCWVAKNVSAHLLVLWLVGIRSFGRRDLRRRPPAVRDAAIDMLAFL